MLTLIYAECRKLAYTAECLYAECQYAECRGASIIISLVRQFTL